VVRRAHPTVIVVTSYRWQLPATAYGLRVPEATGGYTHVAAVRMREGYWQHVFAPPEWAPQVATVVRPAVAQAQRTHDPGRYELSFDRWLDRLRARW
jgi:hypothetical protein